LHFFFYLDFENFLARALSCYAPSFLLHRLVIGVILVTVLCSNPASSHPCVLRFACAFASGSVNFLLECCYERSSFHRLFCWCLRTSSYSY
jgi:hypothetical protein